MLSLGFNLGVLLVQILNLILVLGWIFLVVFALVRLKQRPLSSTTTAVWVLIILLIPLIGAIVYLVFKPGND
jgi:hypothetical protein